MYVTYWAVKTKYIIYWAVVYRAVVYVVYWGCHIMGCCTLAVTCDKKVKKTRSVQSSLTRCFAACHPLIINVVCMLFVGE